MNTSSMYINKFSSGAILALLALSGMLFLVPMAVPVHATNSSPLTYTFPSGSTESGASASGVPLIGDGHTNTVHINIANPVSNQYAVDVVSIDAPTGWTITNCGSISDDYIYDCSIGGSGTSVTFTAYYNGYFAYQLPPGGVATDWFNVIPATGTYPQSGSFSSTIEDASSANFYTGPSFSLQAIDSSSALAVVLTPGGANTLSTYTAGTAPYTVTATLTCSTSSSTCPSSGFESGVVINFATNYAVGTTFSFTPTSAATTGTGTATTTFQPSNLVSSGAVTVTGTAGTSTVSASQTTGAVTTLAAAPSEVAFYLTSTATPFPSPYYVTSVGTSTNTNSAHDHFQGALISTGNTTILIAAADNFGNPDTFGASGTGVVIGGSITVQTASGAVFDIANLPTTATITNPGHGSSVTLPDNYLQGSTYGTAGVLTATFNGATYDGSPFTVSGASGTILTSTFTTTGTDGTWYNSDLVSQSPSTVISVQAGKSVTLNFGLNIAQAGVPVELQICAHLVCSGTSTNYTGSLSGSSFVTNSTGDVSVKLAVDTLMNTIGVLNASITAPTNANPTNVIVYSTTPLSPQIKTISGPAAKFQVSVGVGQTETPSPISYAVPSETAYVNVITTDAYGNIVTNAQSNQIQITLTASPATLTATDVYIPQGCPMTNATTSADANHPTFVCTGSLNSFGAVAWTLPSTAGSSATISASGVLNGVAVTSVTSTVSIVSATPLIGVTSPKPVNGDLYTNTVNVQFKGWANASLGYNGLINMASLGVKVGTGTWSTSSITAVPDSQWSVVETLPQGLSTVNFNATDSKGNVVVLGTPYSVLVDLTKPTITFTTKNDATVNSSNPLTASIVATYGDLNASSVGVTYNGTALASTAITVTGTNNPGSSVTYTVTATLPVGKWDVVVTAYTLAGNLGTSTSETVIEQVAPNQSFTLVGTPTQTTVAGDPDAITATLKNNLATTETIYVIAPATPTGGSEGNFATATLTIAPGATATFNLLFVGLTKGTAYTVNFYAVTSSNIVVSQTTSVSLTA
jgi:hypothetical protein